MTSNIVTRDEYQSCLNTRSAIATLDVGVIPAELNGERVLVLSVPTQDGTGEVPVAIVVTNELFAQLTPADGQVVMEDDEDEATSEGSEDVA